MGLLKVILFPLACLYEVLTGIRNKLFDWGILPSESYDIPIISVGNLSAGGTGKTPHTEYLIWLLKSHYKVAVLSRGYRRKTMGFVMASQGDGHLEIGDEPTQYLRKFQDITIAVDCNRRRGIRNIIEQRPDTQVILLDDAFQHRYVKPGKSILLTDYHRLYTDDYLLPTGMLRESASGARRADYIIITKTPKIFSPISRRQISQSLRIKAHQRLFYSYISYDTPVPFRHSSTSDPALEKYNYIVMFAGVANSYPLQEYLRNLCNELIVIDFTDHHHYTKKDLEKIKNEFDSIISKDKVIFTTEKDAARLDTEEFSDILDKLPVYFIPISIRFHDCDEGRFEKFILDYVQKSH